MTALRTAVVSLGLAILVAGCLTGAPIDGATTLTPTDTPPSTDAPSPTDASTVTPTATATPSPPTPKPLPERPANLTRESVVRFAEAYERAYGWNHELSNDTTDLTVNPVRSKVLNETETGYVVHLEVGLSHTRERDGSEMVGGGFYTVNYFVNGTTVVRAEAGGQQRPGPDPRNGTVVEG